MQGPTLPGPTQILRLSLPLGIRSLDFLDLLKRRHKGRSKVPSVHMGAVVQNCLITIPVSHYCEKARWALEWSGVPYVEVKHLQGFHYLYSYRVVRSPFVPILKTPTQILADSTDIIRWCDSQAPSQRKLLPKDPELRAQVDQLEEYFDEKLGVAGRLWMYTFMLREIPLLLRYSRIHAVPNYEITLMPLLLPLMKGFIRRRLSLSPESPSKTKETVNQIFEDVATRLTGKNFLIGNSFTSADLTFAALSAAVLIPENYGVRLPRLDELPEDMRNQIITWRQHPAGLYARRLYREFRVFRVRGPAY
ncbi:MAG: glutathione S-transferase family protein [Bdellovibrionales bacterium]